MKKYMSMVKGIVIGLVFSMSVLLSGNDSENHSNEVFERTGEQIYVTPKRLPGICINRKVNGNDIRDFVYHDLQKNNPSPEFEKTVVVKFRKGGKYDRQFQLKDIQKVRKKFPHTAKEDDQKWSQWNKFLHHLEVHNAIECPDLIQLLNKDDEWKEVSVVIYGTQNTKHCALYKEFYDLQNKENNYDNNIFINEQL